MIMSMASFFTIAFSFVTVGRRLLCREKEREEKKKKIITWEWYQAVQAENQVFSLEIPELMNTNMQRKRRQNCSFNIKQLHFSRL